MRIIAGSAKGHRLKAPKGLTTRPATDLVRGAIFSILENTTGDWSRVLDLFSGTGALGIEALSRGAGWVDFVEQRPSCCSIIKQNLEKTKLAERAHVYCSSAQKALSFLKEAYSIILLDPPYADLTIASLMNQLAASRLVRANTILVLTHSPRLPLDLTFPGLKTLKEHRHGDSCITVYKKEDKS